MTRSHNDNAGDSPFDHIVDDGDARAQCADWALQQVGSGRSPEEVAAELIAGGWSADDAQEICEAARKRTRHVRGGISHQEVVQAYGARDSSVGRNNLPLTRTTIFGALINVLIAFFRFRSVKDVGKRKK